MECEVMRNGTRKIFRGHGAEILWEKPKGFNVPMFKFKPVNMPGGNTNCPWLSYGAGSFDLDYPLLVTYGKDIVKDLEALKENIDALIMIINELEADPEFQEYLK